jgi:hypothetical protein
MGDIMARADWSNERKAAARRYDEINYSVIGCKLPRSTADAMRTLCKASGISVSAALSVFVRACIDCNSLDVIRDDIPDRKNIDPDFPQGDQASENDTPGTVDIPENASD